MEASYGVGHPDLSRRLWNVRSTVGCGASANGAVRIARLM